MPTIYIKSGKEAPIRRKHPWVFEGAIHRMEGPPQPGEAVDVRDSRGEFLARGTFSSESQIRVRLMTWNPDQPIDETFFRNRLKAALELRRNYLPDGEDAAGRLVFSEADGLPGLIVDRYGPYLAVQLLTQGMEAHKPIVIALLDELLHPTGILDRSDASMRKKEGLPIGEPLIRGTLPPESLIVRMASGMKTSVNLCQGQKTGAYLDQAVNHRRVAEYCRGAVVLDAFCYSGGFSVAAGAAGAKHLTAVDSSQEAINRVRENFRLNAVTAPLETVCDNVFELLRKYRDSGRRFDVIILDPPKMAFSPSQLQRATRAYKDVNLQAMKLLKPGGILATFSCSGSVDRATFQQALAFAALDTGCNAQVVERLSQSPDHPVSVNFSEAEYLKGLICRITPQD